jgi:hypothetical protein
MATPHIRLETKSPNNAPQAGTSSPNMVLEVVVLACLVPGVIGILKALEMEHTLDTLLCLVGSLAACGWLCRLYCRRG